MSFEIKTGLFLLDDFVDHHAILGVPVDADAPTVRKRYLRIARKLHPDSMATQGEAEKKLATQVLSKLVNPAYEMLFQEKNRKEFQLLVRLKGKQAVQQKIAVADFSEEAKKLLKAANVDHEYQQQVKSLAQDQYVDLKTLKTSVGKLSELNLVYLMRKGGNVSSARPATSSSPGAAPASGASPSRRPGVSPAPGAPTPSSMGNGPSTVVQDQPQRMSLADGYLRRAEEYVRKRAYAQAILELRDGLRAAPKDSRCHSLMGIVYLHQKQATMAKVSVKRALELNPQDPRAQEAKRHLERLGHKIDMAATPGTPLGKASSGPTGKPAASSNKSNTDAKKGGLFGGLFGKKK